MSHSLATTQRDARGSNGPLRVAINAQLIPASGSGGVERIVAALVAALGRLGGDTEEYAIVVPQEAPDWLRDRLGPNQRCYPAPWPTVPVASPAPSLAARLRRAAARRLRSLCRVPASATPQLLGALNPSLPVSNGFFEALGCHVVHFPWQAFVVCARPSVYNPHDLQHLHYPEFFSPRDIAAREASYPLACRLATTVVVAADWVKKDVVRQYGIDRSRVVVIPWAAPTAQVPATLTAVQIAEKHRLPHGFAFYPAMLWPHKNHARLLQALAALRDRDGVIVPLVCCGHPYPQQWSTLHSLIESKGLEEQVRFLGLVPDGEMQALYQSAAFMVFPSLFEGGALPILEAWTAGLPVACSDRTMLPELCGDAALLFDATSVESIASAVGRMARDSELRRTLARKGQVRLGQFTWDRTARRYRTVYRIASGWPMLEEDAAFLGDESRVD